MSPAAPVAPDVAPLPERGERVLLDGLPGGPWTTVVDGRADATLALAAPRLGGEVVRLPLRRPFVVAYSHREVPCEVDAELVAGPSDAGPDDTYIARTSGPARRMQRRGAVRVPVHLIAIASPADGDGGHALGAVTENLSAGGALLRVGVPLDAGVRVRLTIQCGAATGTLDLAGRVVRCDREGDGPRPWRAGVAFDDLGRADEDRLVRFVFERQRRLRAREAGTD